jgi:hypothetical protein
MKVMATERMGDVVSGSVDRTIIKRKSHGSASTTSQASNTRLPVPATPKLPRMPTAAAVTVVIAAALTAPAMLRSIANATRHIRSLPRSSVPAG